MKKEDLPAKEQDLTDPRLSDPAEVRKRSYRGGKITLAARGASVALQLASTATVARLLGPEEYGVIAMVGAIITFAGLFRDLGLSSATIQREQLSHRQLSTLYWINVAAGGGLTMIVAAASPLVALFYGRPELTAVTLALSSKFLINGFSTQQGAFLTRQMRFGKHAISTLSGSILGLVTAIYFAANGLGYWALVLSTICSSIVTASLFNLLSGWRPGLPSRRSGIRELLSFGLNITGFELVNYFARNLDNILIGKFCGADSLGLYNRAYQLMMFPISNLRNPINAVVFPAISKHQNDADAFREYYQQALFLLSILSMPVMAALFTSSEYFVILLLGNDWVGVVPIFKILTVVAFIQPASSLIGLVLLGLGQSKDNLKLGTFNACVTVLSFFSGLPWGPSGVAIAYAIATYLLLPLNIWYAFKKTPIAQRDFYMGVAGPAISSVLSALAAMALQSRLFFHSSSLSIGLPLLVFGGLFWALNRVIASFSPIYRKRLQSLGPVRWLF